MGRLGHGVSKVDWSTTFDFVVKNNARLRAIAKNNAHLSAIMTLQNALELFFLVLERSRIELVAS